METTPHPPTQSAPAAPATPARRSRVTVPAFGRRKQAGRKLSVLTAYDYTTARLLDEAGVDCLLVGDSLAMTVLGHPDTLSVTMEEMLHHVRAVRRGVDKNASAPESSGGQALIVADMPFLSYQVSHEEAVRNAGRMIQEGGAHAVKLEGAGERVLAVVRHLSEIGIPVMGHLGFTPQSVHALGGARVQGRALADAKTLLSDAQALQQAGAFALVLEMVPTEAATMISRQLRIPTIGIGAGSGCDGQVLVIDDVLGRYADLTPRFVRRYADVGEATRRAVRQYCLDVQAGVFPDNATEAFAFEPDDLPALHLALTEEPTR
ncbi:MAG: 3-methyl-2-oxobutanoate hydroxymethyltransferase [Candidatus Melainabacteria bacterium]